MKLIPIGTQTLFKIEIQGSDLVLIPFGHWFDNYDMSALEPVLSNYVESGGGLLFTGSNYLWFWRIFEYAYDSGSWCYWL